MMYAKGLGVARDPDEAARWYRVAAERGHQEAQQNLAHKYWRGKGVPLDRTEAVTWMERAVGQSGGYRPLVLKMALRLGALTAILLLLAWLIRMTF